MLSCSSCGSENSDDSCICQNCQSPLQVWRVLIIPQSHPWAAPLLTDATPAFDTALTREKAIDGLGLANQDRYRLEGPLTPVNAGSVVHGLVIDCQPQVPSPLGDVPLDELNFGPSADSFVDGRDSGWVVPKAALPYLALQTEYFPSIPELHHAWSTQEQSILLIEDRTNWLPLAQAWAACDNSVLQKIHWLYEMLLLWEALTPWQCQTSLLQLEQLKVDAHQLLCLSSLIPDCDRQAELTEEKQSFQPLGRFWCQLLQDQLPLPYAAELTDLAKAVAEGITADASRIADRLAGLAEQCRMMESQNSNHPDLPLAPASPSGARPIARETDLLDPAIASFSAANPRPETAAAGHPGLDSLPGDDNPGSDEPIDAPTMMLPMKLVHLEAVGRTHVGQQRSHNEDSFYAYSHLQEHIAPAGLDLSAQGLFILCDGMGGHASGEVASQLAVDTLRQYFKAHWQGSLPDEATLHQAIFEANQAIFKRNQQGERSGSGRMGTTLVLMLIDNLKTAVVHVGDSRLYSYDKKSGLKQLTVDHEVGQREINRGIEPAIAYTRPDAYQLTQALGPRDNSGLKPSIGFQEVTEDTLFILCTDGMSDNDLLEQNVDTHIAPLLRSKASLDAGLENLIELANEKNGHDNITAILIKLKLRPDTGQLSGQNLYEL